MTIFSSRVLAVGVALALAQSALAQDAPEAEGAAADAPVVRNEVRVKKNEQRVVKDEKEVRENDAEIEKRLEEARERLEQAAREVAELSSQLTGPVMHDYVMKHGKSRAVLGINVGDSSSSEGVQIDSVSPNGAAARAGLRAGDVITALDGKSLKAAGDSNAHRGHRMGPVSELIRYMRTVTPGDKVQVEYLRDGKKQKVDVVTEELKAPRFTFAVPAAPIAPPAAPAVELRQFRVFPGMHEMELVTLTPKLGAYFGADRGVLVVRAPRADEFKLEEGDVIIDIDGREPESGPHALRILRSYAPGEKVTLNVLRNRKKVRLEASVPRAEKMSWEFAVPGFDRAGLDDLAIGIEKEVRPKVKALVAPNPQ